MMLLSKDRCNQYLTIRSPSPSLIASRYAYQNKPMVKKSTAYICTASCISFSGLGVLVSLHGTVTFTKSETTFLQSSWKLISELFSHPTNSSAAAVICAKSTVSRKSSVAFILCFGSLPKDVRLISSLSWYKVPLSPADLNE